MQSARRPAASIRPIFRLRRKRALANAPTSIPTGFSRTSLRPYPWGPGECADVHVRGPLRGDTERLGGALNAGAGFVGSFARATTRRGAAPSGKLTARSRITTRNKITARDMISSIARSTVNRERPKVATLFSRKGRRARWQRGAPNATWCETESIASGR